MIARILKGHDTWRKYLKYHLAIAGYDSLILHVNTYLVTQLSNFQRALSMDRTHRASLCINPHTLVDNIIEIPSALDYFSIDKISGIV